MYWYCCLQMSDEYPSAIDELGLEFEDNLPNEMQRARSILCWIGLQNIQGSFYQPTIKSSSVMGHLKQVAEKKMDYATLYAVICRYTV